MKAIYLACLAAVSSTVLGASLGASAALAAKASLTDDQMDGIFAGSNNFSVSVNGQTVQVSVNGNRLQITGDASALNSTAVKINGATTNLNGSPLDITLPGTARVVVLTNPNLQSVARFALQVTGGEIASARIRSSPGSNVTVNGQSVSANATSTGNSSVSISTNSSVSVSTSSRSSVTSTSSITSSSR